ncbi:MAG: hypothetical protein FGM50_07750 [Mycobacterium sp.]|nr:hypothetical protein [Mycobacterium sp.]
MALATASVVALAPTAPVLTAVTPAAPSIQMPAVHIDDIALAGIGRDIYDSITSFVQYTVSSAQYWIALIPVIGPPIADQVGINYFGLIQPVIANTVYVISDIIADPFNFVALGATYFSQLGYIGYNWASDQATFFGLPPFPPIPAPPPLASVKAPVRGAATPSPAAAVDAAAVEAPAAAEAPAAPAKAGAVRAARKAQAADTDAPRAAATVAKAAAATDEDGPATEGGESRSAGKAGASRGGAAGR